MDIPTIVIPPVDNIETISIPLPTADVPRYVLQPDSDISGEPAEVTTICNAVWTDAIKDAWKTYQASLSPE